jgi:hypothetical protein
MEIAKLFISDLLLGLLPIDMHLSYSSFCCFHSKFSLSVENQKDELNFEKKEQKARSHQFGPKFSRLGLVFTKDGYIKGCAVIFGSKRI